MLSHAIQGCAAGLLLLVSPMGMSAAQSSRVRAEHERLLRDESARLLSSRYEASFADARAALDRGDLERARGSLVECLRNKPRDPQASGELDEVNRRIAAVDLWNGRVSAIVSALEKDDWAVVDRTLQELPQAPPSVKPPPHAELIAILRLGAQGRLKEARRAAAGLVVAGRETRAASGFARFVNARMRAEWIPTGVAVVFGAYCLALFGSLYFGLLRARQETISR